MQGKQISCKYAGKEYSFLIKETPLTGIDEMHLEDKKNIYLSMINSSSSNNERNAKALATVESVVLAGLDVPPSRGMEDGASNPRARAFAVASLPIKVINYIISQYFSQFGTFEEGIEMGKEL